MKNKVILSFIVAVSLIFSSCEKNFEPQIYGSLFSTNFPKTESDYEAYMMTCYVPFTVNWGFDLSGYTYNLFVAAGGQMRVFDSTSDYSAPWVVNTWGAEWLTISQANFANTHLYALGYQSGNPNHFGEIRNITRFTQIIGDLQNATVLTDAKKNSFVGEARLLRGLLMYNLLHMYGPVPVILDPKLAGDIVAAQNLVRPTLEQMDQFITDDLEFAVANMSNTAPKGRYTADYAKFCLMKHYLNEGGTVAGYYDKALALYPQLKASGYGLYTAGGVTAYADQFKQNFKFNKEVIMAVSTSKAGDGSGKNGNFNPISWYVIPANASKYADAANTIPTPFVNQGGGWAQYYNVAPKYYDTYEAGDLRQNVILTSYVKNDAARTVIGKADIGTGWSGYIINKYPVEIANAYQPTDIPLARWADVLLMYAELTARKTNAVPTGEALQGVNDVRARAGLAPLSGTAVASYAGFMDALLAERGHEFLYEGFRKIDLIRFNKWRHNVTAIKGVAPSAQYMQIPDYAVLQATTYGKTLTQTWERSDYAQDN